MSCRQRERRVRSAPKDRVDKVWDYMVVRILHQIAVHSIPGHLKWGEGIVFD